MRRLTVFLACLLFIGVSGCRSPRNNVNELRTASAFESFKSQGPGAVYSFLEEFPKGADLHVHLSGAVYAETFIREAGEDGLCVDTVALKFAKPPCTGHSIPATALAGSMTPTNQDLYNRLVDAFSMRSFVATNEFSGHDQFFSTFDRFGGLDKRHAGEWVDEVANRSGEQNQQYLELMDTPPFGHAAQIAYELGWNEDLAAFRRQLIEHGLRDEVAVDRDSVRQTEVLRHELEHCGTPQATWGCQVETRYIYQVLRGFPPQQVFAQTLLGFETVEASMNAHDDTWVGINFVMPEDGYISMRDYTLQMKMLSYLHAVYPKVHISLHAGELAPGLVPPEGMRFHIRQAVELGHAERIGHGVDILYEDYSQELLKEMARKHVMVEINLSSNEGILGVKGDEHPFAAYRDAHVPVALSTDDEGVSRIDLTHEYARAAIDYHLSYVDLKQMARTGMEHNFLPGASLWARPDRFDVVVNVCKADVAGMKNPSAECKAFLDGSEKATAQWEQERRFKTFETKW
jgi:adenosine deaminase